MVAISQVASCACTRGYSHGICAFTTIHQLMHHLIHHRIHHHRQLLHPQSLVCCSSVCCTIILSRMLSCPKERFRVECSKCTKGCPCFIALALHQHYQLLYSPHLPRLHLLLPCACIHKCNRFIVVDNPLDFCCLRRVCRSLLPTWSGQLLLLLPPPLLTLRIYNDLTRNFGAIHCARCSFCCCKISFQARATLDSIWKTVTNASIFAATTTNNAQTTTYLQHTRMLLVVIMLTPS
jgi:hypothetical protein